MKFPGARILVIDDNREVVEILAAHLREAGYRVSGALTGDEGLEDFTRARQDLILLDISLPGEMNGIELLRRLRVVDPSAKVIMVTGNTDPALAREALELGALDYIDKPFDSAYLKRVVAAALRPSTGRPDERSSRSG
jgi:DNA-binding response OmpR family regulator